MVYNNECKEIKEMTRLTLSNTQEIKGAYRRYLESFKTNISQAYNKPSCRKTAAWEYCRNLCREYGGQNLKVIGHNCMTFSAGFTFIQDGQKYFCWITPTYNRFTAVE